MGLVGIMLIVLLAISSLLLILIVLIQDEQGEGIGGLFSGGSTTPFGSRAGNVLTRFTGILAAVFLFTVFALAWYNRNPESGNVIGKARQEALNSGTATQWWVENTESGAPTDGGQAEATDAAPTEGN